MNRPGGLFYFLEPGLFVENVSLRKFLVGFCEINYALDDADDGDDYRRNAAEEKSDDVCDEHDDALGRVA